MQESSGRFRLSNCISNLQYILVHNRLPWPWKCFDQAPVVTLSQIWASGQPVLATTQAFWFDLVQRILLGIWNKYEQMPPLEVTGRFGTVDETVWIVCVWLISDISKRWEDNYIHKIKRKQRHSIQDDSGWLRMTQDDSGWLRMTQDNHMCDHRYLHPSHGLLVLFTRLQVRGLRVSLDVTRRHPASLRVADVAAQFAESNTWYLGKCLGNTTNERESYRRKFRSETSDNMDSWKAEVRRVRREKIRREKIRRERVRRKKMQMREKVGKSRFTVFFQWFVAPEGRKVGSLKRRVRTQLARWEMKKCTPLWREAHFQVKMYKTHHSRTTFGSWDVEKVHAVVARSTFPSQKC